MARLSAKSWGPRGREWGEENTHICQSQADVGHPLQQVEAARRRWRMTAIALLIALAGVLTLSAHADLPYPERVKARTVEAEEIVLKDSDGHVRARFSVQGNAARLIIFDEQGKALAVLPERARMKELGQ